MAEELIENLSRLGELRLIASTSSFALRGQDIATVGEGSDYYRQALKIDPEYAEAHALLGMHHCLLWIIGYDPSDQRRAEARAAATRALELDGSSPRWRRRSGRRAGRSSISVCLQGHRAGNPPAPSVVDGSSR